MDPLSPSRTRGDFINRVWGKWAVVVGHCGIYDPGAACPFPIFPARFVDRIFVCHNFAQSGTPHSSLWDDHNRSDNHHSLRQRTGTRRCVVNTDCDLRKWRREKCGQDMFVFLHKHLDWPNEK